MFQYTCPHCQRSYELVKATTAEARTCNYCGHPIGPDEVLEQWCGLMKLVREAIRQKG